MAAMADMATMGSVRLSLGMEAMATMGSVRLSLAMDTMESVKLSLAMDTMESVRQSLAMDITAMVTMERGKLSPVSAIMAMDFHTMEAMWCMDKLISQIGGLQFKRILRIRDDGEEGDVID